MLAGKMPVEKIRNRRSYEQSRRYYPRPDIIIAENRIDEKYHKKRDKDYPKECQPVWSVKLHNKSPLFDNFAGEVIIDDVLYKHIYELPVAQPAR